MTTSAEAELLELLRSALLNGRDDEDSLLAVFKSGEYFSHCGRILSVSESEWLDSVDDYSGWTIWTEQTND